MVLLAAPTGLTAQNNLNPIQNEDGLYGFKDQDNKVVIPCQWIHAGLFSEGLAPVMDDNDKYGYINNTGNTFYVINVLHVVKIQFQLY